MRFCKGSCEVIYRVRGFVRFYHITNGYGFIRHDAGRDVFIYHRVVYTAGFARLVRDLPIVVDAVDGPKGSNAVEIIEYTMPPEDKQIVTGEISPWTRAKLKWFDPLLGYGFFELNDGGNVLIHGDTGARNGIVLTRYMANARKEFVIQYAQGPKGVYATLIREVTE